MTSTLLLALWLAGPSIASDSPCPSARAIESYLSVLLPAETAPPGTVQVAGLTNELVVDLQPEGSTGGAQRSIAVQSDCDERARAAAVLIATWWPAQPAARPRAEAEVVVAPPVPRTRHLGLSAGAFASAITGGVAPGARIETSLSWRRLGLRVAFSGTATQGGSLGRGRVDWQRLSAESGPTYGRGHLRIDAGAVASVVFIQGSSFIHNQSSTGFTAGATAGLRAAWPWGSALPWVELRGIWWPASQSIYVTTTAGQLTRPMPHGELQLGAGVAFSFF